MGTSAPALAQRWLRQLRGEFGKPYLSVQGAAVPLGEARAARLLGNIVGPVRIESDGRAVAARWEGVIRTVVLTGQEVGQATITISDEKSVIRIPVQVAKYAVQFDAPVTATVTGNPPSQFAAESAVAAAVQAAIHPEPGASCEIITEAADVSALYPGHTAQVPVRIIGEGSGYLPYRARPRGDGLEPDGVAASGVAPDGEQLSREDPLLWVVV